MPIELTASTNHFVVDVHWGRAGVRSNNMSSFGRPVQYDYPWQTGLAPWRGRGLVEDLEAEINGHRTLVCDTAQSSV